MARFGAAGLIGLKILYDVTVITVPDAYHLAASFLVAESAAHVIGIAVVTVDLVQRGQVVQRQAADAALALHVRSLHERDARLAHGDGGHLAADLLSARWLFHVAQQQDVELLEPGVQAELLVRRVGLVVLGRGGDRLVCGVLVGRLLADVAGEAVEKVEDGGPAARVHYDVERVEVGLHRGGAVLQTHLDLYQISFFCFRLQKVVNHKLCFLLRRFLLK